VTSASRSFTPSGVQVIRSGTNEVGVGHQVIKLPHGELRLPLFLPDATQGVVRSVDSADLERCGVQAVVMNTFHLMQRPGSSTIQALGGLHQMCSWPHPIITDSGGFQAYSLIRQNARFGQINDSGIIFRPEGSDRKLQLTPEKSVQLQIRFGADVVICLDDCTHVDEAPAAQEQAVRRTIAWAKRCRAEFDRVLAQKRLPEEQRPLLFAVIQGGGSFDLRRQCAEALLEIGFDGYGYGGWPLDASGNLLAELLEYTRSLIPPQFPMHALGVGHPANVAAGARMGYGIFDSAMPTRDARHGRLYAFRDPTAPVGTDGRWLSYVYVGDDKHIKDDTPLSRFSGAAAEPDYPLGYLHHLFKIGDSLFFRLATMHNLRFMAQLTERLREPPDA
jgi:queuine tRNA-ribosyltransferase